MNEEEWLTAIDTASNPLTVAREACEDCPSARVWCRRLAIEPNLEVAKEGLEATRGWIDQSFAYACEVFDLVGADFRDDVLHFGAKQYEKLLQPRRSWEDRVAKDPSSLLPYLEWELAKYQTNARLDFCRPLFERILTREKGTPELWLRYIRHEWVDKLSLAAVHLPQPTDAAQLGLVLVERALRRFPGDPHIITTKIRLLQSARRSSDLIEEIERIADAPEAVCLQLFSSLCFFARTGSIDPEPIVDLLIENLFHVENKVILIDFIRGLDSETANKQLRRLTTQRSLPDHIWAELMVYPPEYVPMIYQRYRSHADRVIANVEKATRHFYLTEGWAAALEKQQPIWDSLQYKKQTEPLLKSGSMPAKWSLLISGISEKILSPLKPSRTFDTVSVLEFNSPSSKEKARDRLAIYGQVWDGAGTVVKCEGEEHPKNVLGTFRLGHQLFAQFRDARQANGGPVIWPQQFDVSISDMGQDPSILAQWCPQITEYVAKRGGRMIYASFPTLALAKEATDILISKSLHARLMLPRERTVVVKGPEFTYKDAKLWGAVETFEVDSSSWVVIYGTQPMAARAILGINGSKGLVAKSP